MCVCGGGEGSGGGGGQGGCERRSENFVKIGGGGVGIRVDVNKKRSFCENSRI